MFVVCVCVCVFQVACVASCGLVKILRNEIISGTAKLQPRQLHKLVEYTWVRSLVLFMLVIIFVLPKQEKVQEKRGLLLIIIYLHVTKSVSLCLHPSWPK